MDNGESLAYAAGLFDGEGCVHIGRWIREGRMKYHLSVLIAMTTTAPLGFMRERFGGRIRIAAKSKKQQWEWRLYSKEAVPFLLQVLPYLKVKDAEAAVGILFQATFNDTYSRGGDGGQRPLPRRITELREFLWQECRAMKRFNA